MLHWNESSSQKTLHFQGRHQSCFVKENNHLSQERCTVITVASSRKELKPATLKFAFKGKWHRVTVNPPNKVKFQCAEKGSYQVIKHMLEYINRLPNILVTLFFGRHVIFTLEDYSAHLSPEIKTALFQKRYFLIHIGSGITWEIQVNDTIYQKPWEAAYWKNEIQQMLDQLKNSTAIKGSNDANF